MQLYTEVEIEIPVIVEEYTVHTKVRGVQAYNKNGLPMWETAKETFFIINGKRVHSSEIHKEVRTLYEKYFPHAYAVNVLPKPAFNRLNISCIIPADFGYFQHYLEHLPVRGEVTRAFADTRWVQQ